MLSAKSKELQKHRFAVVNPGLAVALTEATAASDDSAPLLGDSAASQVCSAKFVWRCVKRWGSFVEDSVAYRTLTDVVQAARFALYARRVRAFKMPSA